MSTDSPQSPDASFVKQRWIPRHRVEWVTDCNQILVEHGAVVGSTVYKDRHQARWRAQSLIRYMVELRLHDRWDLREHTEKKGDGWIWTVEYLRRDS